MAYAETGELRWDHFSPVGPEVPDHFACPVCQSLMSQPVLLVCCGRSCCERCVLEWMRARERESLKTSCVACSLPLRRHRSELVRNVCLRQAIEAWCITTGYPLPAAESPPERPVPTRRSAGASVEADTDDGADNDGAQSCPLPLLAQVVHAQHLAPRPPLTERARGAPGAPPDDATTAEWLGRLRHLSSAPPPAPAADARPPARPVVGMSPRANRRALAAAGVPDELLELLRLHTAALRDGAAPPSAAAERVASSCLACLADLAAEERLAIGLMCGGVLVCLFELLHAHAASDALACAAIHLLACLLSHGGQPLRLVVSSALPGLLATLAAGGRGRGQEAWRALAGARLGVPSQAVVAAASHALADPWPGLCAEAACLNTAAACVDRLHQAAATVRARAGGAAAMDAPGRRGVFTQMFATAMRELARAGADGADSGRTGVAGTAAGGSTAGVLEPLQTLRYYIHPGADERGVFPAAYRSALCTLDVARELRELIEGARLPCEAAVVRASVYCLLDLCRGLPADAFALVWPEVPLAALLDMALGRFDGGAARPEQQLAAARALWQLAFYDEALDALDDEPTARVLAELAERSSGGAAAELRTAATAVSAAIARTRARRQALQVAVQGARHRDMDEVERP